MSLKEPVQRRYPRKEEIVSFIKSIRQDEEKLKAFCAAAQTSLAQVRQVAYGERPLKVEMAVNLHKHTNGQISMFRLLPHIDWAYMISELKKEFRAPKK